MIKITPSTLGREEMAWLWTALKADYRPTFPFQVSVVLIEPPLQTSSPLPVLTRKVSVKPGPPPQLWELQPPSGQSAATPGDSVTIAGASLAGASFVVLSNARLGIEYPRFAPSKVADTSISFTVPDDPGKLPAGGYSVWLVFTDASGAVLQSTNSLSMAIAPKILAVPTPTVVHNASGVLVTLSCDPQVLPNQSVSLALGGISVPAQLFKTQTASPSFQFPALAPGPYLARLSVDGAESPVQVNWAATPPTFTGPMVTV
jgi:hypothetical protein